MIAYASRTGTKRNLAALREAGWHLMVSARGVLRTEGFPYALDNGAWTAFAEWRDGKRATPQPCIASFVRAVERLGHDAEFIVVPDIVMGGAASLAMSRSWLRKLRRNPCAKRAKLLIAVQNGMEPSDIERFLCHRVGIFVGGDTDWKLATMAMWSKLAHAHGAICHVGRVNSARRIACCEAAGIDSFDGSSASRFAVTLRPLELARQQIDIEGYIARRAA
ncbi:hypothetical protein [uncultured Novosphingobium sp.]|uniref:hypothetical protein n=1 Tax=uncultured Novosphingobium sp. TaxID=292277 RepID=UPI0025989199|nr:hypothetical protein [uncultured Novosphingobium sp.]